MENYHEEQILGKAYDSRLMKRLLGYARPYWKALLISVLLLVVITEWSWQSPGWFALPLTITSGPRPI